MPDGRAIEVSGLTKAFGDVRALKGIDLQVGSGEVFGLLGPNGAGKTTAIRILTTLLPPDSGSASVAGHDVVRDAKTLRSVIGLAGQFAAIDANLTGFENLEMVGRLYHLSKAEARTRANDILERFDLTDAANRTAKTYSGGMRRRLDVGASLVGQPEVLFLDEPTTGLDPRSRIGLWELIRKLVNDGTTVLLTTQYLEEADALSDRMVVIDEGVVIAEGTGDELKRRVGGEVVEIRVPRESVAEAANAISGLSGDGAPEKIDEAEGDIVISAGEQGTRILTEAVRRLDSAGIALRDVTLRKPTLDDVFLSLTGHAAEQEKADSDLAAAGKGGRERRR